MLKLVLLFALFFVSILHEATSLMGCRANGRRVMPGYVTLRRCVANRKGTNVVVEACGLYGEIFQIHGLTTPTNLYGKDDHVVHIACDWPKYGASCMVQETLFKHHRFFSLNSRHMEVCLSGKVLHFDVQSIQRLKKSLLLVPVQATVARHHGSDVSMSLGKVNGNAMNSLGMWSDEYDWFDPNSWLVF